MRKQFTIEDIEQRLLDNNRPITILSYGGKMVDSSSRWKCLDCGHEWTTSATCILDTMCSCPKCAIIKVSKQLCNSDAKIKQLLIDADRPIILLDYGGNMHSLSTWKCTECDWEWPASATHVIHAGSGCTSCAGCRKQSEDEIKQRLIDDNRPITLLDYGGSTSKESTWKCHDCGRIWVTKANSVLNRGTGCASCSATGFNPGKPGYFYLKRFSDFIKIGITQHLDKRHDQLDNQIVNETLYTIEDAMSWQFEDGSHAAIVESMVLKAFKDRQHTDLLETSFDGRTELLNISVYDEIVELLNEVTAAKGTRMPSIIP